MELGSEEDVMAKEYSLEKDVLFESLRANLPGLSHATDGMIEAALGIKSIQPVAEMFVALVQSNLDQQYVECPKTKLVLLRAATEQMSKVKRYVEQSRYPQIKVNARNLVDNIDYLESWYDEAFPGYREAGCKQQFQNFMKATV